MLRKHDGLTDEVERLWLPEYVIRPCMYMPRSQRMIFKKGCHNTKHLRKGKVRHQENTFSAWSTEYLIALGGESIDIISQFTEKLRGIVTLWNIKKKWIETGYEGEAPWTKWFLISALKVMHRWNMWGKKWLSQRNQSEQICEALNLLVNLWRKIIYLPCW